MATVASLSSSRIGAKLDASPAPNDDLHADLCEVLEGTGRLDMGALNAL